MGRSLPCIVLAGCILTAALEARTAEPPSDSAPADTWPLARGSLAGTGRSDAVLTPPLAEAWRPHRGALAIFTWHHYGAGPDVDAAPV